MYSIFLRLRWLLPPGIVLGTVSLKAECLPIEMPLCRYSLSASEIDSVVNTTLDLLGASRRNLNHYHLEFHYGPHGCGLLTANGCTHPFRKITIALKPYHNTWYKVLTHELGHVVLLSLGTDGDPKHLQKLWWNRIKEV